MIVLLDYYKFGSIYFIKKVHVKWEYKQVNFLLNELHDLNRSLIFILNPIKTKKGFDHRNGVI